MVEHNSDNPLHSQKFKNIGVDPHFVKDNATEYNDKISKLYHGGKKEDTQDTSLNSVIQRASEVQTIDTPMGQRVEPVTHSTIQSQDNEEETTINTVEEQTMDNQSQVQQPSIDTQELLSQIETMIDEKVNALAQKMQQYANETDSTINQLQDRVTQLHSQPAAQQEQKTEVPAQQTLPNSQAEQSASKTEEKSPEADVSIENMFNFSGNASGKLQR